MKEYYFYHKRHVIIILLLVLYSANRLTASEIIYCDTFSLNALRTAVEKDHSVIKISQINSIVGFELLSPDSSFKFIFCEEEIQYFTRIELEQMIYLAAAYFEYTLLDEAKQLLEIILINSNQNLYSKSNMMAHNYLGIIADLNDDWLTAYFHFQRILEWEDKNPANLNFSVYLNLGALSTTAKDFENAAHFFQKGLAIKQVDNLEYGWLLHRLGELRLIQKDFSKAKEYLKAARDFWKKKGYWRGYCFSTLKLGRVYFDNKEEKKALDIMEKLVDSNLSFECELCRAETFLFVSRLYFHKEEPTKAKYYLTESKKLAEKESLIKLQKEVYEEQMKNAFFENNLKEGLNLFQTYKDLNLEINNAKHSSTTKSMKYIDNLIKKVQDSSNYRVEKKQAKVKLRQQRWTITVMIILLIMTTIMTAIFFLFNRKNKRSKNQLEILNQKNIQQKKAINKANLKIKAQNQTLHLQLVKKAMMMQEYSRLIKEVKKLTKEKDFHSQKWLIGNKIDQVKTDELEAELNIQISNANQELLESLSKEFPNLTQNEKRLCALLKMNLTTKEIANLTFKTPESVKVARSRLRKKLGLTHQKIVIGSFLNQFEVKQP